MPFKFWKRDKGKEKAEPAEAKEEAAEAEAGAEAAPEAKARGGGVAEAAPVAVVGDVDAVLVEAHAGLVDLGLTIPATKGVFLKRAEVFPGGATGFVQTYRTAPFRATTKLLSDWLGFRAPAEFDPEVLLKDVNLRLSSFKMSVRMSDLTWLDQELSLRKARLQFDSQEKVVRFKDARDFIKGINELTASRRVQFLELETWSDEFAFMLVREPKWDKLATTEIVVVKAPQTALGGECGECGAAVGPHWHDCLSCGAVFGSD